MIVPYSQCDAYVQKRIECVSKVSARVRLWNRLADDTLLGRILADFSLGLNDTYKTVD